MVNKIPEIFHSYETKAMFDRCIDCDMFLLDGATEYFIEKSIKKYPGYRVTDVIFEYAICARCAENFHNQMSSESKLKIQEFMMKNVRHQDRESLIEKGPQDPTAWIDRCLITGKKRDELDEYQVCAHCIQDLLILPAMPYMISGEAIDRMSELLSNKTLDEMDGFIGKHFGPPDLEENPDKKIILI